MLKLSNMRPGEKVEFVIRRHWIVYMLIGLYFKIGLLMTLCIYLIMGFSIFSHMLIIMFWLVFSIFLYVEWLNHELDMYVVTNNRIIGLDQISFLNRTVSECNLGQVQEANSRTKGFFANIFNFGDLSIQTAGNKTTLKMGFCPNSMEEARKILNIVDDYRDKAGTPKKDL